LIFQPYNRGTAAGVLLALTYIKNRDRDATVVIYPSDHFVYPEQKFLRAVSRAVSACEQLPGKIIVLGVAPERAEPDYGWIQTGDVHGIAGGCLFRYVERLVEKPCLAEIRRLFASGGLWNTMITIGAAETLWTLGWQFMPELICLFEWLEHVIDTSREDEVLQSIYGVMPSLSLSSDLLQLVSEHLLVTELEGLLWCDWGRPKRIVDTLQRIGKQPAFDADRVTRTQQ
jgi:mannose-1-phosphate guanylyltransferase